MRGETTPQSNKRKEKMNSKPVQLFESTCGKARVFVENDMPIGVFHDFLMMLKGLMVDRMIAAHQEQVNQAAAAMNEGSAQETCTEPCEVAKEA